MASGFFPPAHGKRCPPWPELEIPKWNLKFSASASITLRRDKPMDKVATRREWFFLRSFRLKSNPRHP
jgi:hypothetical protein